MSAYKLYTDGSYLDKQGIAGFGGYIKATGGEKVLIFSELVTNPHYHTHHEICGLIHGLNKCVELGIKEVKCYLDAKSVADLANIKTPDKRKKFIQRLSLAQNLYDVLDKFENVTVTHIYREKNKEADKLSHVAINQYLKEQQAIEVNSLKPTGDIDTDIVIRNNLMEKIAEKKNSRLHPSIPNTYCNELFNPANMPYYENLKKHTKIFLNFDLANSGQSYKLVTNLIEKVDGEFLVKSSTTTKIKGPQWKAAYLSAVNNALENVTDKQVGLVFTNLNQAKMQNLFNGLNPLDDSAYLLELNAIKETAKNFSAIVLNCNSQALTFINSYNSQVKTKMDDSKTIREPTVETMPEKIVPQIQLGFDFISTSEVTDNKAEISDRGMTRQFDSSFKKFLNIGQSFIPKIEKSALAINQKILNLREKIINHGVKFRL